VTEHKNWITTGAGVQMPRMIYGTAWKKERTADLVERAVKAGFRGIDTACQPKHYEESLVGAALQKLADQGIPRGDLYVQTKFTPLSGQDPNRVPYDKRGTLALQVAQSFTMSKTNLRTDYVDGLILHSPLASAKQTAQVWCAMEEIYRTGGARQLGISNCYDIGVLNDLYDIATVKPAIVQNRFYRDTQYDVELRQWCASHGVIYQSFWTLSANPHILVSATLRAIADHHQKTEAQILFRYLTHCGIVPLTGTCSEQHMKEDLDVFDFELAAHERDDLGALIGRGA